MLSNKLTTRGLRSQSYATWESVLCLIFKNFYFSCSQSFCSPLPTKTLLPLKGIRISFMLPVKPGDCQFSPSAAVSIPWAIQIATDLEQEAEQQSLWWDR